MMSLREIRVNLTSVYPRTPHDVHLCSIRPSSRTFPSGLIKPLTSAWSFPCIVLLVESGVFVYFGECHLPTFWSSLGFQRHPSVFVTFPPGKKITTWGSFEPLTHVPRLQRIGHCSLSNSPPGERCRCKSELSPEVLIWFYFVGATP